MRRYAAMGFSSIAFLALLFTVPTQAQAVAVTLQLTIDKLTRGRAVLSGDLDDTFADPTLILAGFQVKGKHWFVDADLTRATEIDLKVTARHISDPPPDPGEATPGLLLGGAGAVLHNNIDGANPDIAGAPGPQDASHRLIHPGSDPAHFDILASHVDDLNGEALGFATADRQISVRIDLTHTPEPSSLLLVGSGLLGLAGWRRRSR